MTTTWQLCVGPGQPPPWALTPLDGAQLLDGGAEGAWLSSMSQKEASDATARPLRGATVPGLGADPAGENPSAGDG